MREVRIEARNNVDMLELVHEESYIAVQNFSIFYIISRLFNALGPTSSQLCDSDRKKNVLGCVRHNEGAFFTSSSVET